MSIPTSKKRWRGSQDTHLGLGQVEKGGQLAPLGRPQVGLPLELLLQFVDLLGCERGPHPARGVALALRVHASPSPAPGRTLRATGLALRAPAILLYAH